MSYPSQPRLQALAALTALMVAACGGGGGSSDPAVDPAAAPAPAAAPTTAPSPTPATPPPTALELSTAFLAAFDQSTATAPATGAAATALQDSCFLDNGANKQFLTTSYDAAGPDALASVYGRVQRQNSFGAKRTNIQVLEDRKTTNADGSARREIDVKYDIIYPDGTTDTEVQTTLIAGSSSGSCATPDNKSDVRFFGNRALVDPQIIGRNTQTIQINLSDGSLKTPNAIDRREVRFQFRDPGQVASYIVVSGPGPIAANGKSFSLKLLSPRIVRDAPELAGKPGTATFSNTDGFQICTTPNGTTQVPEASIADCVGSGVQGDTWGYGFPFTTDAASIAAADQQFNSQGWVAGGVYTVSVYADDGWKTINGQDGKKPIATYTKTLEALPYTFAQKHTAPSRYPKITAISMTLAQIAEAARTGGGVATFTWDSALPPPGGSPMGLLSAYTYADGPKSGSTTGFPRVRELAFFSPALNTTTAEVSFTGKNPATDNKRIQQFVLSYTDRQGHIIMRTLQFF